MNKEQVLIAVKQYIDAGIVNKEDIRQLIESGSSVAGESGQSVHAKHTYSISQILYYIGASVILIGIVILLAQNWSDIGAAGRILSTLGAGIVAYTVGVLFMTRKDLNNLSQAFSAISGALLPAGIIITFNEAHISLSSIDVSLTIALIMCALFGFSLVLFRRVVYSIFVVIFASWLYGSVVVKILDQFTYANAFLSDIYQYSALVLGLAYLVVGYGLIKVGDEDHKRLAKGLYALGGIVSLSTLLSIGGFWDALYPFVIFGVIYLSVYLQSKALLRLGAIFLMVYLIKVTAKYFSNMLSWPLALVLSGFLLMGIGYATYYLNKKYIAR